MTFPDAVGRKILPAATVGGTNSANELYSRSLDQICSMVNGSYARRMPQSCEVAHGGYEGFAYICRGKSQTFTP